MLIHSYIRNEQNELEAYATVIESYLDVKDFSISNREARRCDGSFKKFVKMGVVVKSDGKVLPHVPLSEIANLKLLLKGCYTSEKHPIETCKMTKHGWGLRKAIDWHYTIKAPKPEIVS